MVPTTGGEWANYIEEQQWNASMAGRKMTMPDEMIWAIQAFLRKLPDYDAAWYYCADL